jgi:DNA-binding FrmR family transcriptional regulator
MDTGKSTSADTSTAISADTTPDVGTGPNPEAPAPGYHDQKDAHLKRLRRIEGQVRGLQRMIESDTYCIDVLVQISAATRALQAVALGLLDEHMAHCVAGAVAGGGPEGAAKLKEASEAIARLVRS